VTVAKEPIKETWGTRLEQYRRREQMTTWFGGGFLGLVSIAGLLSTSASGYLQRTLVALLISSVVLGGACLALARVGFEWKATEIARRIDSSEIDRAGEITETAVPWPARYEFYWTVAQWVLLAGGVLLLALAWAWAEGVSDAKNAPAQVVCATAAKDRSYFHRPMIPYPEQHKRNDRPHCVVIEPRGNG